MLTFSDNKMLSKFLTSLNLFNETCIPEIRMEFLKKKLNVEIADDDVENTHWGEIHIRNFKCSIDTQLHFVFIFHKTIAFNDFLFNINRIISLTLLTLTFEKNCSRL